uniref:Uncharacterized protein n=1 Tax=Salix viminalis TaxID=40686 RepID=A0A6N2LHN5_SALVM
MEGSNNLCFLLLGACIGALDRTRTWNGERATNFFMSWTGTSSFKFRLRRFPIWSGDQRNSETGVILCNVAALGESQLDVFFKGETEETWEFHQQENEMILDFENNKVTPVMGTKEKSYRDHSACDQLKERKNHYRVEKESGTKRNKHSSDEAADQHGMFAEVFPSTGGDDEPVWLNLNETFQNGPGMMPYLKEQSRGSNYGMISMKNQVRCREMVDTRTLLIHCAEAVAGNDHGSAIELLTQIRQHSTPFGDGSQRLAHCFSNALEARMAGTGSEVYANLAATESILKASRRFISASPFMVMSNFFSTQTIMDLSENAARLHIIHFGILYGFPWPSLIQHLSARPGGPPVLRVTGVEFPQTGCRSAETIEEIGPYLASYCEKFNVPFEYNAISQKWKCQLEDLKIDRDEVTVVSSLYRFRRLLDETVVLKGHRDAVISLIRRINPAVFIHGIVNGLTILLSSFRVSGKPSSTSHHCLICSKPTQRVKIQRDWCLNKRIERPEKYKQWQARNVRAGLRQLPLKEGIMEKVREQVKSSYHKDFLMDQDGQWMLQGWRGFEHI